MLLHEVLGFDRIDDGAGDRAVLVPADGGPGMSLAQIRRHTAATAARLGELGVRPGERIAILGEKTPEVVAAFLGASLAGAVYVPLDPAAGSAYWSRLLA